MKRYWSLIGFSLLILIVGWLWYQALFAYLAEHTYYFSMLPSKQNRLIFVSSLICVWIFPITYLLTSFKLKIKNLLLWFVIWAWVFGLIHSNIKWDPIWFWNIITIFNTILLVSLWIYLILWFSALWSRMSRKLIKFNQLRWQEIFLSFWIWFCSFVIIVQILLWTGLLYWIVSWILFLWLGFMIWNERKFLKEWWEIIENVLEYFKTWITSEKWNLKIFKKSKVIWYFVLLFPVLLSLAYLYIWIQNAFVPYSTAWDANHEYMYIPKILAENGWIYRWNSVASNMPWFWHQFLTFIFSLTGCTNWWLGLSPDNIAISMNNISATLVLLFWIAIIFQAFNLINFNKNDTSKDVELGSKKWNNIIVKDIKNVHWISLGWYVLLLWLTGWMWAFLVIVDNKTDLWVMALSLLALLSGLIFLQKRKDSKERKEVIKYIIIAWLFFWFAALAKITAFVDFVLFGLLLVGLWLSPVVTLWLWMIVAWLVRKLNVLTSSVMLTDDNALRFIVIWLFITALWIIFYLLKRSNRKNFWSIVSQLFILWISFLIPLILLKLPRTTVNLIRNNNYSFWKSLKSVFLSINTNDLHKEDSDLFLAQNTWDQDWREKIGVLDVATDSSNVDGIASQDYIDTYVLNSKNDQTFSQCTSAGNVYSESELNKDLKQIIGWWWWEDFWRYIWYGWKEFKSVNMVNVNEDIASKKWYKFFKALRPKDNDCPWNLGPNNICEKNIMYWILKKLWPTSDTCYWFNHDAKILCNNSNVINTFKIEDLNAIYENWIKNKEWEAWLLLKKAIDAYNEAKAEWKLWLWTSNAALFHDEIVNLTQYYQWHSIFSDSDSVNIPYRYLVPLNITFNWSLQNLSSYYTDIWFIWIIIFIFLIIALPYAIIKKDKLLISTSLTTIIWWWIRRIIWSSILWYGTVLISRTMITIALLWDRLINNKNRNFKLIHRVLIVFVWVFFWIQILFNFLRIASQWASSVFVWYKWNVGNLQIVDENLQTTNKVKYWYSRKNIFDLQFNQYNPIINALADRKNDEWVIIAWTYIQYFLWNQWNIKLDWMLNNFWRKTSDWDLCKTYWRLKWDNTRYLIIDPNIWTVTMWEWNETLFYRFFWKLNNNKSKIEIDWTITTLIRLAKNWYLKLLSTNNLWSKYAFTLDDNIIKQVFGNNLTDEELILTRSKMAVLQYFSDAESIFKSIVNIFKSRVLNDKEKWIEDIADIYWFEVNCKNIAVLADKYLSWQPITSDIKNLSQNERIVLINFLNIYWSINNDSVIQKFLLSSVTWWSQIIALELN